MRYLYGFTVVAVSLLLSLFAAELMARVVLDPVDYLLPTLVNDDYLFHRVEPYTGGHDAWGFRNLSKPKTADIVCIGDSMTYGINATVGDAWPAALGALRSTNVYNMSLGGYGPFQYLHLMRTKAVELHPKIVIVGFYFGNDLLDAYNEVRFNKYWHTYGANIGPLEKAPAFAFQTGPGKFLGSLRDWLSRHSVMYAIVTRSPIFDFVRKREMMAGQSADDLIPFRDAKHNTIFNVSPGSVFVDMTDPRIESAVAVTQKALAEMKGVAAQNHFRLIVVLLPTKESVYGELLAREGYLEKFPPLANVVRQEGQARRVIVEYLQQRGIEMLDVLPALRAAAENTDLFPPINGHPNKSGYRIIAETVNAYLAHHSGNGGSDSQQPTRQVEN